MEDYMNGKELIYEYEHHLSHRKWQWYGSLNFRRSSVPLWMADRCFNAWICEIENALAIDYLRWVRIAPVGAFPDNPIFHVLVDRMRMDSKYVWMNLWHAIAGDADIEYSLYPDRPARFIVRIAESGSEFTIKSEGC
jgi:hypothetical protein